MLYTQGTWQVKAGHADEFVRAWTEFAEWTLREVPGARWAKLLRDTTNENRFISFGPWDSAEAIAAWRALDGWKQRLASIRLLLDNVEVSTLDVAAERG